MSINEFKNILNLSSKKIQKYFSLRLIKEIIKIFLQSIREKRGDKTNELELSKQKKIYIYIYVKRKTIVKLAAYDTRYEYFFRNRQ